MPAPARRWHFMAAGNCTARCRRGQERSSDNNRMSDAVKTAQVACTSGPLSRVDVDVLIVPWFEGEPAGALPGLDDAIGGELQRAVSAREFEGRPYDFMLSATVD